MDTCVRQIQDHQLKICNNIIISKRHLYLRFLVNNSISKIIINSINTIIALVAITIISNNIIIIITMEDTTIMHNS